MEMVYLKKGCHQMSSADDDYNASPDEGLAHKFSRDNYCICKFEITQVN